MHGWQRQEAGQLFAHHDDSERAAQLTRPIWGEYDSNSTFSAVAAPSYGNHLGLRVWPLSK